MSDLFQRCDLPSRLRYAFTEEYAAVTAEAANEIERLRAENERLLGKLKKAECLLRKCNHHLAGRHPDMVSEIYAYLVEERK